MKFKEDPFECSLCYGQKFIVYESTERARSKYIKIECLKCGDVRYFRILQAY